MFHHALREALGRRLPSALKLSEQHAWCARVIGNKCDVGEKHRLHLFCRRSDVFGRAIDSAHQVLGHPGHDRFPDRVLVRKVAKDRALRQLHVLGDGRCCDAVRVGRAGQVDDRFNGDVAAFFRRDLFGCRLGQ